MGTNKANLFRQIESLEVGTPYDFKEADYAIVRMFLIGHKAKNPDLEFSTKRLSRKMRRIWRIQ